MVSLILSPLKRGKAMNFDQGVPDGFSGAKTAAPAQLNAFPSHCASFWDSERKGKSKDSPMGTKTVSTGIWKI